MEVFPKPEVFNSVLSLLLTFRSQIKSMTMLEFNSENSFLRRNAERWSIPG